MTCRITYLMIDDFALALARILLVISGAVLLGKCLLHRRISAGIQ